MTKMPFMSPRSLFTPWILFYIFAPVLCAPVGGKLLLYACPTVLELSK